jgi:hypothetical protein
MEKIPFTYFAKDHLLAKKDNLFFILSPQTKKFFDMTTVKEGLRHTTSKL